MTDALYTAMQRARAVGFSKIVMPPIPEHGPAPKPVTVLSDIEGELIAQIGLLTADNQRLLEENEKLRGGESEIRIATITECVAAVAEHLGVTLADIIGPYRNAECIHARHIAMYLARRMTGKSLPTIGRFIGKRDHSTVLHAVNKITAMRPDFPELDQLLTQLETKLRANQ